VASQTGAKPDDERLRVVVETPKGSRNKFRWAPEDGCFELSKVLPAGAVFPFDFGSIPGTRAADGDPLDILILMDTPAFPGCRIEIRLIGVIEARQTAPDGGEERNDRLIGVAVESHDHRDVRSIKDVSGALLDEVEGFFVDYNAMEGRTFKPLRRRGPGAARRLVAAARSAA
jgi:inorganic pyrophosphatase